MNFYISINIRAREAKFVLQTGQVHCQYPLLAILAAHRVSRYLCLYATSEVQRCKCVLSVSLPRFGFLVFFFCCCLARPVGGSFVSPVKGLSKRWLWRCRCRRHSSRSEAKKTKLPIDTRIETRQLLLLSLPLSTSLGCRLTGCLLSS